MVILNRWAFPARIFDFAKKYLPSVTSGVLLHLQKVVLVIVERALRVPIVTARQNSQLTSFAFEVPLKRVDRTGQHPREYHVNLRQAQSFPNLVHVVAAVHYQHAQFAILCVGTTSVRCMIALAYFSFGALYRPELFASNYAFRWPFAVQLPSEDGRDRWDPVECTWPRKNPDGHLGRFLLCIADSPKEWPKFVRSID